MTFSPLPDDELQRLSDEGLIAYISDSRDHGEMPAARRGLMFLVHGYGRDVERRVSLRVPAPAVEDVAQDALVRAVVAAFDGTSIGEFRNWLHTIVDRTAADYHRRLHRRPREAPLPTEHAGGDDVWGDEPAVAGESGAVELRIVVEEVLEGFNEKHRRVIELHVFGGLQAAEVCDRIEGMMSPDNVAQIASRFRRRLRERLESDVGGGT